MKRSKLFLILILLLIPITVFASSYSEIDMLSFLVVSILLEMFFYMVLIGLISIPISMIVFNENINGKNFFEVFIKLLMIKFLILMIYYFMLFVNILTIDSFTNVVVIDWFITFVLMIVSWPIASIVVKPFRTEKFAWGTTLSNENVIANTSSDAVLNVSSNTIINSENNASSEKLVCSKCGYIMALGNKYCIKCGTPFDLENQPQVNILDANFGTPFDATKYDSSFFSTKDKMALFLINNELNRNNINPKMEIPEISKRKAIFTIIFSVILFIMGVIFFAYHKFSQSLVILFNSFIIYIIVMKNYNLRTFILKQVKARPEEKISYIITSITSNQLNSFSSRYVRYLMLIIPIIILCFLFWTPHLVYEKSDDGYVVRYYTIGITNNVSNLTIPSTYKNEDVVGIRGSVFYNVSSISSVELPETIKEIRGGAFSGCSNLKQINIPSKVTEIKGETFENCTSLLSINIPDEVTRIGGHAFYNCQSLSSVEISENSKLNEIGSSAFRLCSSLDNITIPSNTYVNERAFKESPTIVYRYGYHELVNGDDYQYDTYIYLKDNEQHNIITNSLAVTQEIYLRLVNVTISNGKSTFTLEYTDATETITFDLTEDNPIKEINENLVIFVKGDYSFSNREKVGLYIYYN